MVQINENWLRENVNEKAGLSYYDRFVDYINKPIGIFRTVQGTQKTLSLGGATAGKKLSRKLGGAIGSLGTLRIPSAVGEAVDSVSALKADSEISLYRRTLKAVGDVSDAIATCSYSHMFITGSPALKTVAQVTDFTNDLVDLKISRDDYLKAADLETAATGDAKVAVTHTKTYQLLRVVKAVAAIASTIFGVVLLALGMPLVAFLTVSLTSTLFAILRDLYKDAGRFKVISLDREVTLI